MYIFVYDELGSFQALGPNTRQYRRENEEGEIKPEWLNGFFAIFLQGILFWNTCTNCESPKRQKWFTS